MDDLEQARQRTYELVAQAKMAVEDARRAVARCSRAADLARSRCVVRQEKAKAASLHVQALQRWQAIRQREPFIRVIAGK